MEDGPNLVVRLAPVILIGLWAWMLYDTYNHADNRRNFWLVIILIMGIFGYIFFRFSPDRK